LIRREDVGPHQRERDALPLLVFDAWEHAYYLQYRNARPDYVTRLRDIVNWADLAARYAATRDGEPTSRAART
jgi:superoxide dismutase